MSDTLETRPSLLLRIRDAADASAWGQFVEIYTPLLYRYSLRRGLQQVDAEDVTQDVLSAVARAIHRFEYDTRVGKFRGWLFTLARNRIATLRVKMNKTPQGIGSSEQDALDNLPAATPEEEQVWQTEYESRLFHWAAEQVRPQFHEDTWQAFWRNVVESVPAAQVAEQLGVSVGAIYIAKSRVLARLRQKVQEVGE